MMMSKKSKPESYKEKMRDDMKETMAPAEYKNAAARSVMSENRNMDEARPTDNRDAMNMVDMRRIGNMETDAKHREYHGNMVKDHTTPLHRGQV